MPKPHSYSCVIKENICKSVTIFFYDLFYPKLQWTSTSKLTFVIHNKSASSISLYMEMSLNGFFLRCLVMYSVQNDLWKPHLGCFSSSNACCIFIQKIWLSEKERGRRKVLGLSQFVAYIPNKESWKPVRDQSYSPKGLTARCPHNTFKASNSPPDQMQPGSGEKHWPLRLEPVFCSQL